MGSCHSLLTSYELKEQTRISREIDKTLVKPKVSQLQQTVLLLGPGESGKSTVLKQMRMMAGGLSKEELLHRKHLVNTNFLNFTTALRDFANLHVLEFSKQDKEISDVLVLELEELQLNGKFLNAEIAMKLKSFWAMPGIQEAYEKRDVFHLPQSAKYFFDNLDRISKPNYEPTHSDIVHIRIPTKGVVSVDVVLKNIKLTICDVGGQRTERRKWHHLFDENNAVLFVAAVSEYDQKLVECEMTNRLRESIRLFGVVFNGMYFKKAAPILFMNKIDIFQEKIKTIPIVDHFDKYRGDSTWVEGIKYFRSLFHRVMHKSFHNRLYAHETCAISDQVKIVINTVVDTVVQENLKDTGMI